MKNKHSILGLAAGAALLVASGCSKPEQPATPSADNSSKSASSATPAANVSAVVSSAVSNVQETVAAQKAAAEQAAKAAVQQGQSAVDAAAANASNSVSSAVSEAQKAVQTPQLALTQTAQAATNQVQADNTQFQGLLERAKGLVANQKYQDALGVVQQISSLKLTADQQKLVDDLKAQVQAALAKQAATNVTSALGNILGGKK